MDGRREKRREAMRTLVDRKSVRDPSIGSF